MEGCKKWKDAKTDIRKMDIGQMDIRKILFISRQFDHLDRNNEKTNCEYSDTGNI